MICVISVIQIWLRLVLLSGILLSTTCNPISSRTTNRLEEIRAKATAKREKLKASNAKILSRIRSSPSHPKKTKRQLIDDFGEDVSPEMFPTQEATQKFYILGQQPIFERSIGDESDWVGSPVAIPGPLHHKIHHPQHGKFHKMPVYKPHHMIHHPMKPSMHHGHMKHQRFRSNGVPSFIVGCAQEPISQQDGQQAVEPSSILGQEAIHGEDPADDFGLENSRDAHPDPTFHHHIFHGHHYHKFHHIPPPIPFVTPVTSGINLHINQNQGFSSSLQGGTILPQGGILPSIQGSIINQQQQVAPSFQSQISQSQIVGNAEGPIFRQGSSPISHAEDQQSMDSRMFLNGPNMESGRNADPNPGFLSDLDHQTKVHITSGIASGIKSGIASGIDAIATKVKGVASELSSGITKNFSAGIKSGVSSEVTPGQTTSAIVPDITSGISSVASKITKVSSGIAPGVTSEKVPGITSGITSGVLSDASKVTGVASEVTSNITPGLTSGVSSGISATITPGILPGFSAGITPSITPGVVLNINTNQGSVPASREAILPQHGSLLRSSSLEPSILNRPKDESDLEEARNADADPSFLLNSYHQNKPQSSLTPAAHTVVPGIASDIASGVSSMSSKVTGATSGITPKIISGITEGVTSVTSKVTGVTSGITPGLTSGVTAEVVPGIKPGTPTGISPVTNKVTAVTSEVTSSITPGISQGFGSTSPGLISPQHGSLFRSSSREQSNPDYSLDKSDAEGTLSADPTLHSHVHQQGNLPGSVKPTVNAKTSVNADDVISGISSDTPKITVISRVTPDITPNLTSETMPEITGRITSEITPGITTGKSAVTSDVTDVSSGTPFRSSLNEQSDLNNSKNDSSSENTRNAKADPTFHSHFQHQSNLHDSILPTVQTVLPGIKSGIASGVSSVTSEVTEVVPGITGGITSGVTSEISPEITSGISSVTSKVRGITSGIKTGIAPQISAGMTPGINQGFGTVLYGPDFHHQGNLHGSITPTVQTALPGIKSDIASKVSSVTSKVTKFTSGIKSELTPGVTSRIVPGITGGITSGVTSETSPEITSGISSVTSKVTGIISGIKTGIAPQISAGMMPSITPGINQGFGTVLYGSDFHHQDNLHGSITPTVQTVLPGITSGITSQVSSVTSKVTGITSHASPGITSGYIPAVTSGIPNGNRPETTFGITAGEVTSGIAKGVSSNLNINHESILPEGSFINQQQKFTQTKTFSSSQIMRNAEETMHEGGYVNSQEQGPRDAETQVWAHSANEPNVRITFFHSSSDEDLRPDDFEVAVSPKCCSARGITKENHLGTSRNADPHSGSNFDNPRGFKLPPGIVTPEVAAALDTISKIKSEVEFRKLPGATARVTSGITPDGHLVRDADMSIYERELEDNSGLGQEKEPILKRDSTDNDNLESSRDAEADPWNSKYETEVHSFATSTASDSIPEAKTAFEKVNPKVKSDLDVSPLPDFQSAFLPRSTQKEFLSNMEYITEPNLQKKLAYRTFLENSRSATANPTAHSPLHGSVIPGITSGKTSGDSDIASKGAGVNSRISSRMTSVIVPGVTSGIFPRTTPAVSQKVSPGASGQQGFSESLHRISPSIHDAANILNPSKHVIPGVQASSRAQASQTQIEGRAEENQDRQSQPTHEQNFGYVDHESRNLDMGRASEEPNMHVHFFSTAEDNPNLVGAPYIFNVPRRRDETDSDWNKYKRSTKTDSNQVKSDSTLGKKLKAESQLRKIVKRASPLIRLLNDPNAKLDLSKTLENFGSVTRRALEDRRAPMYHLNHLLGSSKNAVMSALKVPPHNLIIPSDYDILRISDRLGAQPLQEESSDEDREFTDTFVKLGHMVRDSFKSGRDTAAHIGDVASDARNIFHTARLSGPRLLAPYAQVPALQKSSKKPLLLTPEERLASRQSSLNAVRLGHIMDAVGLSKPVSSKLALDKLGTPSKSKYLRPSLNDRLLKIYNRVNNNIDDNIDTVGEAVNVLEDARLSTGAKSLRDFLVKMKNEVSSIIKNKPNNDYYYHAPTERRSKVKKKKEQDKEVGKFIENLFDQNDGKKPEEIMVGDIQNTSPVKMASRMHISRDSEKDRKHNTYTLTVDDQMLGDMLKYFHAQSRARVAQENINPGSASDLGYVLGAINPLMFERMYNETLESKRASVPSPQELFQRPRPSSERKSAVDDQIPREPVLENGKQIASENGTTLAEQNGETVGTGMKFTEPMLKPFMGQIQPEVISKFMDSYNNPEENSVEMD